MTFFPFYTHVLGGEKERNGRTHGGGMKIQFSARINIHDYFQSVLHAQVISLLTEIMTHSKLRKVAADWVHVFPFNGFLRIQLMYFTASRLTIKIDHCDLEYYCPSTDVSPCWGNCSVAEMMSNLGLPLYVLIWNICLINMQGTSKKCQNDAGWFNPGPRINCLPLMHKMTSLLM